MSTPATTRSRCLTRQAAIAALACWAVILSGGSQGLAAKPKPKKGANRPSRAEENAILAPTPTSVQGPYLLVDLSNDANDKFAKPIGKAPLSVGKIPFRLPQGPMDHLSLRQAQWKGWQQDVPFTKEQPFPSRPHDPEMPTLRLPAGDYLAAHVLAVSDEGAGLAPAFTFRMGTVRQGSERVLQFDFAARVPRPSEAQSAGAAAVKTAGQPLYYVRVPLGFAFTQDLDPARPLEIEVTKEVRLARRNPDPNRYRWRPLGLPSGVRIAAITLEKSPLELRVTSDVSAHAFVQPRPGDHEYMVPAGAPPTFKVSLHNVTAAPQGYSLAVQAVSLSGEKTEAQRTGQVAAGEKAVVTIPLATPRRGYYDLAVTLRDAAGRELLCRHTSFALLPPDTRKYRDQSPFGTYDYGGAHATCNNMDLTGPLYVKLGMRYGMFADRGGQARQKYGLLKGNEPQIVGRQSGLEPYERNLSVDPGTKSVLLFHETSVSKKSVTRVPDLFTDRPAYQFDEQEAAKFRQLFDAAVQTARAMRQKYPNVKMALGNGTQAMKELLLRAKFPTELFDSLGNECGNYSYSPESQPPMCMGNNASLWMDRQLLDAYGYQGKPVTQCHEICYPATNPGNLDFQTQADHFVRHAMHSLAWGVPAFRPGILMDVGNAYRFSHWGATGFCHMYPEMNVKPSFVAFATMTRVLDGAKFVRDVPLGSPSLYAVQWAAPDRSQIFVLWTLRGKRRVQLALQGGGQWRLVDDQANETALAPSAGKLTVTFTPTPVYLVGKGQLTGGAAAKPEYTDKPDGKVSALCALATLDDWTLEKGRNVELEYYNFLTPRRKGDFALEAVAGFEGQRGAIRVMPRPIASGKETMPMYAVLTHKKGIPVPGPQAGAPPTEIGLWINGNSGWGRVIFELVDASGQRWISIGGPQKKTDKFDSADFLPPDVRKNMPSPGMCDWCTDDAWDLSRINFDGWRYVGFPMPGNYPGEHYGWPATGQWRWDKDGVVHYPLTLKKLVIELREKVLHMKTFAPPPRAEIYLKDLVVAYGDSTGLKRTVGE